MSVEHNLRHFLKIGAGDCRVTQGICHQIKAVGGRGENDLCDWKETRS